MYCWELVSLLCLLSVLRPLYLWSFKCLWVLWSYRALYQHTALLSTPRSQNPHNPPAKIHHPTINTPKDLTSSPRHLIVFHIHQRSVLMSVAYQQAQKQRYRITLDLNVLGDFDPHQIDWEKLFKLEPAERCEAYVEDLNSPDRWWFRCRGVLLT